MSDLVFKPAHQLAQMIRDRAVSAVEVLDPHLAQIAKHNATLNAICTLDQDRARQRVKQADEALACGEKRKLNIKLIVASFPEKKHRNKQFFFQTSPLGCA